MGTVPWIVNVNWKDELPSDCTHTFKNLIPLSNSRFPYLLSLSADWGSQRERCSTRPGASRLARREGQFGGTPRRTFAPVSPRLRSQSLPQRWIERNAHERHARRRSLRDGHLPPLRPQRASPAADLARALAQLRRRRRVRERARHRAPRLRPRRHAPRPRQQLRPAPRLRRGGHRPHSWTSTFGRTATSSSSRPRPAT